MEGPYEDTSGREWLVGWVHGVTKDKHRCELILDCKLAMSVMCDVSTLSKCFLTTCICILYLYFILCTPLHCRGKY